jgi:hypothetical protein
MNIDDVKEWIEIADNDFDSALLELFGNFSF